MQDSFLRLACVMKGLHTPSVPPYFSRVFGQIERHVR